jgi:hypothetical protein
MADMILPTVRARTPAVLVASWSNACIAQVRGTLSLPDVKAVGAVYEKLATEQKEGFVSVIVVGESVGLPADEARQAVTKVMSGMQDRILAMVGILEAAGFKAAALRSIMAVMSMVSRAPYPRKIAGSIGEAAPWIADHVRPSAPSSSIALAISQVKEIE